VTQAGLIDSLGRRTYAFSGEEVPMITTTRSALVIFGLLAICCGSSSNENRPSILAPTGVAATAGDGHATVSWTASSGAASYNVYYAASAVVSKASGSKVAGATSGGAVTGLTNGTAYYFVVTAVNAGGESAESSPAATATPHESFDGDWVACWNDLDGTTDYRERYTIAGNSGSVSLIEYATSDFNCDGDPTSDISEPVTIAYGAQVTANLGTPMYLATQVDITLLRPPVETLYTLFYRGNYGSIAWLSLGVDYTGALDGSAPALRPVSLDAIGRRLQTDPVASDLTGEWRYCPLAGDGAIVTINAVTGTFDATKFTGTCADNVVKEHVSGTYTLAAPVYANFEGFTVTALAVDLHIAAPSVRNVYTTLWVDVDNAVSLHSLFMGDDTIHGMDGSTATLRPRVLQMSKAYARQ
jgi:hypothetical protein